MKIKTLNELHKVFCHHGVRRMFHSSDLKTTLTLWMKKKLLRNHALLVLSASPTFFCPLNNALIKATHPFEIEPGH